MKSWFSRLRRFLERRSRHDRAEIELMELRLNALSARIDVLAHTVSAESVDVDMIDRLVRHRMAVVLHGSIAAAAACEVRRRG